MGWIIIIIYSSGDYQIHITIVIEITPQCRADTFDRLQGMFGDSRKPAFAIAHQHAYLSVPLSAGDDKILSAVLIEVDCRQPRVRGKGVVAEQYRWQE